MGNSPDDNSRQDGFAGTLRNIQLTDIIQMCCLAGASMMIRVSQGQQHGTIHIINGEILHAECGEMVGEDAFLGILQWEAGSFETLDAESIETPTIQKNCQFLLMEAARLIDERQAGQKKKVQDEESLVELEEASRDYLRVLIVDDSVIMCKILSSMLRVDPGIEVVGTAGNGEQALKMIKQLSPDLITLDVNMPVMDGSTALKHIMIQSPCPVLIMSNLVQGAYSTILDFLNLGAVDFVSKPVNDKNIVLQQQKIVQRVHLAATADVTRFRRFRPGKVARNNKLVPGPDGLARDLVIVLSGTGGYLEAVRLLTSLDESIKAAVIATMSAPPLFLPTLVDFLDARCRFTIEDLNDRQRLVYYKCFLSPSGPGLKVNDAQGHGLWVSRSDAEINGDSLLVSAAERFGKRLSVVLLSGGSYEDRDGLAAVLEGGGEIIAPPPNECIVAGQIEEAVKTGLIGKTISLPKIAGRLAERHTGNASEG